IAINCIANHACAHDAEKACGPGMSWDAEVGASSSVFAAQNEQAACGGTEEEEIHGGYVIQNLVIPSGKKDHHRPDTLQRNGNHRHARFRVHPGKLTKKYSVLGHGKVHAWSGENTLAQKSQRRNRDAQSDEHSSSGSHGQMHYA